MAVPRKAQVGDLRQRPRGPTSLGRRLGGPLRRPSAEAALLLTGLTLLLACGAVRLVHHDDPAVPGRAGPSVATLVPPQGAPAGIVEPEAGAVAPPSPTESSGPDQAAPGPAAVPPDGVGEARAAGVPPEASPLVALAPPAVAPEPPTDVLSSVPAREEPMPRRPHVEARPELAPTQALLMAPPLAPTQGPGPAARAWSPAPVPLSIPAPVPPPARRPPPRMANAPKAFDPHASPEETSSVSPPSRPRRAPIDVGTVVSALARRPRSAPRSGDAPSRASSAPWALPPALAPTEP